MNGILIMGRRWMWEGGGGCGREEVRKWEEVKEVEESE